MLMARSPKSNLPYELNGRFLTSFAGHMLPAAPAMNSGRRAPQASGIGASISSGLPASRSTILSMTARSVMP